MQIFILKKHSPKRNNYVIKLEILGILNLTAKEKKNNTKMGTSGE